MMLNIAVTFLLLNLLHSEVNSVITPNPTFNIQNAVRFADDLLKIYNYTNPDKPDIMKILNKMSIEIITSLYNSKDSITDLKKGKEKRSLPREFHAPDYIKNDLEEIDRGIKLVDRLFQPFFKQYLDQNISIIALEAIMVKAMDVDLNSARDSLQKIYKNIHPEIGKGFFSRLIDYVNTNLFTFCFFANPRQYMVHLYESIVTMELRMFVMSTFAYKLNSILTNGSCISDLAQIKSEHLERRRNYIMEMRKALSRESNEFFHCYPIYSDDYTPDQAFAVNLLWKESDYRNNWVVTGVRFVVEKKILHLQLEESRLLPNGQIEPGSERWIPMDDMDYDSETFNNNNNKVLLRDDIEGHYIGLWDYLQYSSHIAPENFVVVGAQFQIHYLYPKDYLNKTIIYLRLMYAQMDPISKQINAANLKFSDTLNGQQSKLQQQFQQFKVGTDRDKQFVNIGYAGYRVDESKEVLTHIDPRSVNLPLRTPLTGIGFYENHLFHGSKAASLKIFTLNETPFFDYTVPFFQRAMNEREKLFTCDVCK